MDCLTCASRLRPLLSAGDIHLAQGMYMAEGMYHWIVSWKRIIGLAVAVMISVMVGALIYEAFDIHDTKLFAIDPEFLLMMLSSMLILCFGIAALVRRLFSLKLSLSELLPLGLLGLSRSSTYQREAFELERLLFSPPLSVTALRI